MIRLEACAGCRDNFYNDPQDPKRRCWHRAEGRMVNRYSIGTWTAPTAPGAFTKVRVPSCYHQSGVYYQKTLPDFVDPKTVQRESKRLPRAH